MRADDKPWSEKQESADDSASSESSEEEEEDDDDDDDSAAHAVYGQRSDETDDDSDAFDYVRVQLPMGGHGDNVAKSQLTANQVCNSTP